MRKTFELNQTASFMQFHLACTGELHTLQLLFIVDLSFLNNTKGRPQEVVNHSPFFHGCSSGVKKVNWGSAEVVNKLCSLEFYFNS